MKNFEDIYWRYKGLIEIMETNPGVYGLDQLRSDLHKELEKHFPSYLKEALAIVLHDLPENFDPNDLKSAVNDLCWFKSYMWDMYRRRISIKEEENAKSK